MIDPSIVFCTARIIGDKKSQGSKIGWKRAPIGTGFLISVPSETIPGQRYGYVITAHHVVDAQPKVEIQASNPFANGELFPPEAVNDWRQPLDGIDLALAPIPRFSGRAYQALELEKTLIPDDAIDWVRLGAEVHYVGIFTPLDRPMVRTGTIGALDQTGIPSEGPYDDYPIHLLDCRSYRGFSGSPCFLNVMLAVLTPIKPPIEPSDYPEGELPPMGSTFHIARLCGMITDHIESDPEPDVASRYGVAIMLRGNEIREALMTNKMRDERRKWDAEAAAAEQAEPKPTKLSAGQRDEFQRFEDLAKKLVNTPKPKDQESDKSDS